MAERAASINQRGEFYGKNAEKKIFSSKRSEQI